MMASLEDCTKTTDNVVNNENNSNANTIPDEDGVTSQNPVCQHTHLKMDTDDSPIIDLHVNEAPNMSVNDMKPDMMTEDTGCTISLNDAENGGESISQNYGEDSGCTISHNDGEDSGCTISHNDGENNSPGEVNSSCSQHDVKMTKSVRNNEVTVAIVNHDSTKTMKRSACANTLSVQDSSLDVTDSVVSEDHRSPDVISDTKNTVLSTGVTSVSSALSTIIIPVSSSTSSSIAPLSSTISASVASVTSSLSMGVAPVLLDIAPELSSLSTNITPVSSTISAGLQAVSPALSTDVAPVSFGILTKHAMLGDPLGLLGYRDDSGSDTTISNSSDDELLIVDSDSEGGTNKKGFHGEDEDEDGNLGKRLWMLPKTKGEMAVNDLPLLEELTITVGDDVVMVQVGRISQIVDTLVIVQTYCDMPPLDMDTILFIDGRKVLGQVFETFGPVVMPLYSVRFNSPDIIEKRQLGCGVPVYYAPQAEEYTHYVFMAHLQAIKGSDASWEHNNEPPAQFIEYSDDDEERAVKSERQAAKRNKRNTNATEKSDSTTTNKNKRNRSRKPGNESNTKQTKHSANTGSHDNTFKTDVWPPKDYRPRPPHEPSSPRTTSWSGRTSQYGNTNAGPRTGQAPPWRRNAGPIWENQPPPPWGTQNGPQSNMMVNSPHDRPPAGCTVPYNNTQFNTRPPRHGIPNATPNGQVSPTMSVPPHGSITQPGPPGVAPMDVPRLAAPVPPIGTRPSLPPPPPGVRPQHLHPCMDTSRPPPMFSSPPDRTPWNCPLPGFTSPQPPPTRFSQIIDTRLVQSQHMLPPGVNQPPRFSSSGRPYTGTGQYQEFGGQPQFQAGPAAPAQQRWNVNYQR